MASVLGNDQEIILRPLDPDKIGQYYVSWMNDPEVVQYLESRWCIHTLDSIRNFVRQMNESSSDFLYGIFLEETGRHIGNIKIGEINRIHMFANIGLLIGEKDCWGKGFGTRAIILATEIAFRELHLNSLTAGIYSNNRSSYRAFLKAGWEDVGCYKKYRIFNGKFIDQINVQIRNES